MYRRTFHIMKALLILTVTLLSISTSVYAQRNMFHSTYFDIDLADKLKLVAKTEDKSNGFYRYIFASPNNQYTELQMRVIVSTKQPNKHQSLEAYQTDAISYMSVVFMESYKRYEYLKHPDNKRVLNQRPDKFKLGNNLFRGITMYFGNIDASFLVTNANNMTYAFTLMSKNNNEQVRKDNLKMLINMLETLKLKKGVTSHIVTTSL